MFLADAAFKSPVFTTYKVGPVEVPWIMLAEISTWADSWLYDNGVVWILAEEVCDPDPVMQCLNLHTHVSPLTPANQKYLQNVE